MGPGIFTTHWKKVLAGVMCPLLVLLAAALIDQVRYPVGGTSPYETVNDLYEWEYMTFAAAQKVYPADTQWVELYFRNDAPDGVVCLAAFGTSFAYELEIFQNGKWHSMRPSVKEPRWTGTTDIVKWNGDEISIRCEVGADYCSPLPEGRYRVVIPQCEHISPRSVALAAEFEVLP